MAVLTINHDGMGFIRRMTGTLGFAPVVVTRDEIGGCLVITMLLNLKFQKILNEKILRATVTPLYCLSVEGMETITPYLRDAAFTDILQAWNDSDPLLRASFLAVENSVIDKVGP